jgi:hypothetical protein
MILKTTSKEKSARFHTVKSQHVTVEMNVNLMYKSKVISNI